MEKVWAGPIHERTFIRYQRSNQTVNRRWTETAMSKRKRTKGQTMVDKIPQRKQNFNQHEHRPIENRECIKVLLNGSNSLLH